MKGLLIDNGLVGVAHPISFQSSPHATNSHTNASVLYFMPLCKSYARRENNMITIIVVFCLMPSATYNNLLVYVKSLIIF